MGYNFRGFNPNIIGSDKTRLLQSPVGGFSQWSDCGQSSLISGLAQPTLASMDPSNETFALYDTGTDLLRAMQHNADDTFSFLFGDISIVEAVTDITGLDANNIAFTNNTGLSKYNYNGTAWSLIGNKNTSIGGQVVTALDADTVAVVESGFLTDLLSTYEFDGTNWVQIGASLDIGTVGGDHDLLTAVTSSLVALSNATTLQFYSWSGAAWSLTDSIAIPNNTKVAALSPTQIAGVSNDDTALRLYQQDGGGAWSNTGPNLVDAGFFFGIQGIAKLTDTSIVYSDSSNDRVYCFELT